MFRLIIIAMFLLASCSKNNNIDVDLNPFDDGKVGVFYDLFDDYEDEEDEERSPAA